MLFFSSSGSKIRSYRCRCLEETIKEAPIGVANNHAITQSFSSNHAIMKIIKIICSSRENCEKNKPNHASRLKFMPFHASRENLDHAITTPKEIWNHTITQEKPPSRNHADRWGPHKGHGWNHLNQVKAGRSESSINLSQARKSDAFKLPIFFVKLHWLRNPMKGEITDFKLRRRFASSPSGFYFIDLNHRGRWWKSSLRRKHPPASASAPLRSDTLASFTLDFSETTIIILNREKPKQSKRSVVKGSKALASPKKQNERRLPSKKRSKLVDARCSFCVVLCWLTFSFLRASFMLFDTFITLKIFVCSANITNNPSFVFVFLFLPTFERASLAIELQ